MTDDQLIKRLRDSRLERGLSQREVASVIGISQQTYSNIETGKRHLRAGELLILQRLMGLALSRKEMPK